MGVRMKHFNEQILKAENIAITGHIHPDGDCIGSCLALKQYILDNYSGKTVDVYLEPVSSEFYFLNHANEIITESDDEAVYDLFFVLDCGSEDRYEPFAVMVNHAKTLIGIDHHISNDGFGDFCKIDPKASATCEVLCDIFEEDKISKECAQCLYTGIVHDTGVFKHSNTTRKTMEYAGMLLEKGVSSTKIIDETFYQKTFVQNQLLGKTLLKSELHVDGKIIFSYLSEKDFEELNASTSDSDGIIDQLRITKGVEAAVFLYPIEDGYKVSMRSNEYVNVAEIAKLYGGGGHIRAAGCSVKGTLEEVKDTILKEITKQL
jgi:phosphoesterase RecJ-like protein